MPAHRLPLPRPPLPRPPLHQTPLPQAPLPRLPLPPPPLPRLLLRPPLPCGFGCTLRQWRMTASPAALGRWCRRVAPLHPPLGQQAAAERRQPAATERRQQAAAERGQQAAAERKPGPSPIRGHPPRLPQVQAGSREEGGAAAVGRGEWRSDPPRFPHRCHTAAAAVSAGCSAASKCVPRGYGSSSTAGSASPGGSSGFTTLSFVLLQGLGFTVCLLMGLGFRV